ncbi:metal-dependent hydrolase [archaeon]|nr:metal-dependent hydrolase [archaeon]
MPLAVTHMLFAIVVADIIRDYILKDKRRFSLLFVLIAGIGGLLPDLDIAVFWIISLFKQVALSEVHRIYTHTLFLPIAFFILCLLFRKKRFLKMLFLMLALGSFIHLFLDGILSGLIAPLFPFSSWQLGLNLVPWEMFGGTFYGGLDALILTAWLIHEYLKHNIKDYI